MSQAGPADVDALVAAGRWADAAAAARAAGQLRRARELYEKIWEFRAAAACALEAGDRAAALRNLVDAGALAEATALAREMAAAGAAEAQEAARVLEARRLWAEAARIVEGLGDRERAAALYQRGGLLVEAARHLEALGRDAEAGRLLERAVAGEERGDALALAHLMLGRILARRRQHDRAVRHLQEARRDLTVRPEASRRLVGELLAMGLRDAAFEALARAREDDPSLPAGLDEFLRATAAPGAGGGAEPLVGGRYRLERLLGAGGSGRVYLARDEVSGDEVAVKMFFAAHARGQEAYQRFVREARVCGALRHAHIVQVLDFREELGFFVMEYMVGGTLADRLRPRLAPAAARRMALEVLSGLAAAHGRGVVHRDIKPANVFFDARGVAKLGDFGVAHLIDLGQTQTGGLIGTLAYMSPEQITGAPLTFAADLYALGVTLYQALTGRLPLLGPDFVAQHLGDTPPKASEAWPELGTAWDALLARLLAKDPAARHGGLDELEREIAAIEVANPARVLLLPRGAGADAHVDDGGDGDTAHGAGAAGRSERPAAAREGEEPRPAAAEARYVHEAPLGETPISTLARAVDAALGRSVVIERFAEAQPDAVTERRLFGLAAALGPHLERVLSWDRATRTAVYEAPVGETLAARLAAGPLAPRQAAKLLRDLADAVSPLHALGLAHGAIDADRVLIDDAGVATLVASGLGAARASATPAEDVTACLTLAERALGPGTLPLVRRLWGHLLADADARLGALPLGSASELAAFAAALDRELARAARVRAHVEALARAAAGSAAARAVVAEVARRHGLRSFTAADTPTPTPTPTPTSS